MIQPWDSDSISVVFAAAMDTDTSLIDLTDEIALQSHRSTTISTRSLIGESEGENERQNEEIESTRKKIIKKRKKEATSNSTEPSTLPEKKSKKSGSSDSIVSNTNNRTINNNNNPIPKKKKSKDECLREITILVSLPLVSSKGGGPILSFLESKHCKVSIPTNTSTSTNNNNFKNALKVIEWTREPTITDSSSSDSNSNSNSNSTEQVLIRLFGEELLEVIESNSLASFILSVREQYYSAGSKRTLLFVVEGLWESVSKQKKIIDKQLKQTINNNNNNNNRKSNKESSSSNSNSSSNSGSVVLTKHDIERVLVWLQIEGKVHIKVTSSTQETIDYIYRITTAIALAPYR